MSGIIQSIQMEWLDYGHVYIFYYYQYYGEIDTTC